MSVDADVISTLNGQVLTLSLNRPQTINSFTKGMHRALLQALEHARDHPQVHCVVLKGEGRGFCAGQDLSELSLDPAKPTDLGELVGNYFNKLIRTIDEFPKPVVAQVHGIAAGAGANLALACDLTIADAQANFLQAFVNIGLMPDSGGSWLLPHLVGPQRALGLALLGEKLSAAQAAQWGLIWQAVPGDELATTVERIAQRLAALPPVAVREIKAAIRTANRRSLSEQLDLERDQQRVLGQSADYFEGVQAFLQKRPAKFTGA